MPRTARKSARKSRSAHPPRRPISSWPVQEARARLSHLLDEAAAGRPQRISRRGETVAVLVSATDFDRRAVATENLLDFFRNSPLAKYRETHEIEFERNKDARRRRIDLSK